MTANTDSEQPTENMLHECDTVRDTSEPETIEPDMTEYETLHKPIEFEEDELHKEYKAFCNRPLPEHSAPFTLYRHGTLIKPCNVMRALLWHFFPVGLVSDKELDRRASYEEVAKRIESTWPQLYPSVTAYVFVQMARSILPKHPIAGYWGIELYDPETGFWQDFPEFDYNVNDDPPGDDAVVGGHKVKLMHENFLKKRASHFRIVPSQMYYPTHIYVDHGCIWSEFKHEKSDKAFRLIMTPLLTPNVCTLASASMWLEHAQDMDTSLRSLFKQSTE